MAGPVQVLSRGKDGIDLKEMRQLTKDFKDWKPDKQLKKMLREAGVLIADDAKVIVSRPVRYSHTTHGRHRSNTYEGGSRGSKSVPPTIKARLSKTRLSVVAGGASVPLAGLLELGNKGRGKSQAAARSGVWRHPIYGNKEKWVYQGMNPYLLPAAEMNKHRIEALEGKAVAESFREYRFPVS